MIILFYTLVFLAIWHFFYESVLAPSLRHSLRYDFFKLRDELRYIKMNGIEKSDERVYEVLDHSICNIIRSMSFISLGNYYLLKKNFESAFIKKSVEYTKNLIASSNNDKLLSVDHQIGLLGSKALFINNGSWILYLILPITVILVISLFTSYVVGVSKKMISKISSRLIYSPKSFEDIYNIEIVTI